MPETVQTILDVGCGAGAVGFDLLRRCPSAKLVAVDVDPSILREATRRAPRSTNCSFAEADVFFLPFAAGTFDVVACQYLLQHLTDPVSALTEMRRVAHVLGKLAVFEWDDGANFSFPAVPHHLSRLLEAKVTLVQLNGGDRFIGRKLYHLLHSAGWTDVQVRIIHDIWQGPADHLPVVLCLATRGTEHRGNIREPCATASPIGSDRAAMAADNSYADSDINSFANSDFVCGTHTHADAHTDQPADGYSNANRPGKPGARVLAAGSQAMM